MSAAQLWVGANTQQHRHRRRCAGRARQLQGCGFKLGALPVTVKESGPKWGLRIQAHQVGVPLGIVCGLWRPQWSRHPEAEFGVDLVRSDLSQQMCAFIRL